MDNSVNPLEIEEIETTTEYEVQSMSPLSVMVDVNELLAHYRGNETKTLRFLGDLRRLFP